MGEMDKGDKGTHMDTLVSIVGSVRTFFQLLWQFSIREWANLSVISTINL